MRRNSLTRHDSFIKAEQAIRDYEQDLDERRLQEALDLYGAVIVQDAAYGEAYYRRSWVYGLLEDEDHQNQDLDMAVRIFAGKLKQAPHGDHLWYHLGMVYRRHHRLEHSVQYAWDHFTQALAINPAHSQAMAALAAILKNRRQGNESAIQYYNQAIQIEADNAEYYFERGECFDNLKQYDAALADYVQAIMVGSEEARPMP